MVKGKADVTRTNVLYRTRIESLGVSIQAGYRRSTAACRTSYRRLFDFINENKNDINKKKQIQQRRRLLEFLNATKTARYLMHRTLEITFLSL